MCWKIHLGNCFLHGLKPDIASAVKISCIWWNDARRSELRTHDQDRNWERKIPSDFCLFCGQRELWRRDCPTNTSSTPADKSDWKWLGVVGEGWTPADKPNQLVRSEGGTAPHTRIEHIETHSIESSDNRCITVLTYVQLFVHVSFQEISPTHTNHFRTKCCILSWFRSHTFCDKRSRTYYKAKTKWRLCALCWFIRSHNQRKHHHPTRMWGWTKHNFQTCIFAVKVCPINLMGRDLMCKLRLCLISTPEGVKVHRLSDLKPNFFTLLCSPFPRTTVCISMEVTAIKDFFWARFCSTKKSCNSSNRLHDTRGLALHLSCVTRTWWAIWGRLVERESW